MGKEIMCHGVKYSSASELCRAYNLNRSTYEYRLKLGLTPEEAVDFIRADKDAPVDDLENLRVNGIPTYDHEGNLFRSVSAMCRAWGIRQDIFKNRIQYGWTFKEALTTPVAKNRRKDISNSVIDFKGNTYDSKLKMCLAYEIPVFLYDERIASGMSVKEALTTSFDLKKGVYDHKGKWYRTKNTMCRAYGINSSVYNTRFELGWELEEILTTPLQHFGVRESVDHLGNKFKNKDDMCRYWGISRSTLRNRLNSGWNLKDCLTIKPTKGKQLGSDIPTADHLGNEYDSFSAMCKAYGKLPVTVRHRLRIGLSLKDALTLSEVKKAKNGGVKDHLGNWFASKEEMCSKYGISVACYNNRLKYGWSQEEALTTAVRKLLRIGKCK